MSLHHSFDIKIASEFSVVEAIIIHHFQYWINFNRQICRNLHEGRFWSFQTLDEICAHFPYFQRGQVERIINKLVESGVLLKGNFNKKKYDRTVWYAFKDQEKYLPPIDISRFREMEISESRNGDPEIETPIPDPKQDSKEQIHKEPPKPEKAKKSSATPQVSAEADSLCTFFFEKIRERNPSFKEPNLSKWKSEMDLLLRIDKREVEEVKTLINWMSDHKWWKTSCLSPSKLRKDYDSASMQFKASQEASLVRSNRTIAMNLKDKHPEQMKCLSFDDKFAINRSTAKEIPFNLPEATFKRALVEMFGGQYVGRD